MKTVTLVQFVMVVDGKAREAVFVRREKIDDLLNDSGSLGDFLRDFRDAEGGDQEGPSL